MQDVQIQLLANCVEYIPQLAKMWLSEIGKVWIPNASIEKAVDEYRQHANATLLPITFVATVADPEERSPELVEGHASRRKAVGMVSLRDNDGIRPDLTPWLGSLIVIPEYRQKGIGQQLIEVVKQQAHLRGFQDLYLLTLDKTIPTWYESLGWKKIAMDKLYHHSVNVMQISLSRV